MFLVYHFQPDIRPPHSPVSFAAYQCCCSNVLLWKGSTSVSSLSLPNPRLRLPQKVARRFFNIRFFSSSVHP